MTNQLVVVSDLHSGCRLGLCPPKGVRLDDGGMYRPSAFQRKVHRYWLQFWDGVDSEASSEPWDLVVNGDMIDGVHHRATTQVSHNLEDQSRIAEALLAPVVEKCPGQVWVVRGTEAHVESSAREEERLARRLGAVPNSQGQFARWELWKTCGNQLVHFLHHVSPAGNQAGETTAVFKELIESYTIAGKWRRRPPNLIVRSHRHRYVACEVPVAGKRKGGPAGFAKAVTTPAWQGKTPFVWKIAGGRLTTPQFGGLVIRLEDGELVIKRRVWTVGPSPEE